MFSSSKRSPERQLRDGARREVVLSFFEEPLDSPAPSWERAGSLEENTVAQLKASIFAARMKSFSLRPPIAWVVRSSLTLFHATLMPG